MDENMEQIEEIETWGVMGVLYVKDCRKDIRTVNNIIIFVL